MATQIVKNLNFAVDDIEVKGGKHLRVEISDLRTAA
jgi:hypothetical protein